jgi:hypothetical protein
MTATLSNETGIEIISAEERRQKQAELFKICQDEVIRRWASGVDEKGRSTLWKANAAREDIANQRPDSSIMDALAKEVCAMMEKYF